MAVLKKYRFNQFYSALLNLKEGSYIMQSMSALMQHGGFLVLQSLKKTVQYCPQGPRASQHCTPGLSSPVRASGWMKNRQTAWPNYERPVPGIFPLWDCSEKAWEEITSLVTAALCRNSLQNVQGRNFAAQNENNHVWLPRWVWGGRQGQLDYRTWKHHAAAAFVTGDSTICPSGVSLWWVNIKVGKVNSHHYCRVAIIDSYQSSHWLGVWTHVLEVMIWYEVPVFFSLEICFNPLEAWLDYFFPGL